MIDIMSKTCYKGLNSTKGIVMELKHLKDKSDLDEIVNLEKIYNKHINKMLLTLA